MNTRDTVADLLVTTPWLPKPTAIDVSVVFEAVPATASVSLSSTVKHGEG